MSTLTLDQAKKYIAASGLEKEFLSAAGLDSLDDLSPKNFDSALGNADSLMKRIVPTSRPDEAPAPPPTQHKSDADAPPKSKAVPVASDILFPYLGTNIIYAVRKAPSSYTPIPNMMFYIVHLINNCLVDNFYFKRSSPEYHPYVLRLYFAVLFVIQSLRAAHHVKKLDGETHEFLTRFLANHSPESLSIPGPLLPLFKTLCCSQPEIQSYGKVYPLLPAQPGPAARSSFAANNTWSMVLPNVPGIFALLEDLNAKINATPAVYPKKGKHTPVAATAVTFGHHAFPAAATRSDYEKWHLVSPGLEYPCEADAKLNEAFAERYEHFDFPATDAADDLSSWYSFMSMSTDLSWFSSVSEVAQIASSYFEGSGTLADCSPFGNDANQFAVHYSDTATVLPAPTSSHNKASLTPFVFRLATSRRSSPPLSETMAAFAQTHARFPSNHPMLSSVNQKVPGHGSGTFWDISPIERSPENEESFHALQGIVKKMMKSRV